MKDQPNIEIPKDGLPGLQQNAGTDILSGFLVFLIALPLSLAIGIAATGGANTLAGIIAAAVGGVVVSLFMGGRLTIKGPAAGLITIVLGAVTELGNGDLSAGYHRMLAVVVIAGAIQIAFGFLKFGKYGDFFPASAVHGMLASIGLIIISKQIHVLLGVKPTAKEPLELLAEIPHSLANLNPYIFIIGLAALAILIVMPFIKNKYVKMVPAPLIAVLVSILLAKYFDLSDKHDYLAGGRTYSIDPAKFLVNLPANILDGIQFPDWGMVGSAITWKYVVLFALIGTLESLLTVKAVDGLDPYKRKSNMNQDVLAQGAGNLVSGLIGGLPMISEVVRSRANIDNGARTRWSNFFHGLFLVVFVLAFPGLIGSIPNAALAAMLVFTGYRLASPQTFKNTYAIGWEQLVIFCSTIVVTLATDLLVGIGAGILVKFILHLVNGAAFGSLFRSKVLVSEDDKVTTFYFKDVAVFSNYLSFKTHLEHVKPGKTVVLDFSEAPMVDHTFMEHIQHFEHDYEHDGGKVVLRGLEKHIASSSHPLATRKLAAKPLK